MSDPRYWAATVTLVLAPLAGGQPPAAAEPADREDIDDVTEAPAEDAAQADAASARPALDIELSASAYFPGVNGHTAFGRGASAISLEDEFDFEEWEATLDFELTLRFDDRWYVRGTWFDFSTDGSGTFPGFARFGSLTLLPGDAYRASFDVETYSGEVGVDLLDAIPLPSRRRPPRPPSRAASLRVRGFAGGRFLDVGQTVVVPSVGRESGSGDWLALYGGLQLDLLFVPEGGWLLGHGLELRTCVAVGGDVKHLSGPCVEVRGGLCVLLTPNAGVTIGYRLIDADFEDGDFAFDGGLRGLLVGGSIRF